MTNDNQTEQNTLTYDEKLDALMRCVYENNQMLNSLLEAVNRFLNPPNSGVQYPAGYPNQNQPASEFDNRFTENKEYKGAEEDLRASRTYTQMGNLEQAPPPSHHPPPIPPGGMPPPPAPSEAVTTGVGGEVVMTPDEYRAAHGE
jgi:hypothetical protein